MGLERLQGWEFRLYAVIDAARDRPYVLGEHDCFRLTCSVIEALTGADRWPAFAGYSTRREAMAKLAAYGKNFELAGDRFFGGPRIDVKLARRGDIAVLTTHDGEKHLGVVLWPSLVYLHETGLLTLPWRAAHAAWRVG